MMTKTQLATWLDALPEDAEIGIDDGGLCLQVFSSDEYLEIGGLPEYKCEHCDSARLTTQSNGTVVCDACGHEQREETR